MFRIKWRICSLASLMVVTIGPACAGTISSGCSATTGLAIQVPFESSKTLGPYAFATYEKLIAFTAGSQTADATIDVINSSNQNVFDGKFYQQPKQHYLFRSPGTYTVIITNY